MNKHSVVMAISTMVYLSGGSEVHHTSMTELKITAKLILLSIVTFDHFGSFFTAMFNAQFWYQLRARYC